MDHLQRTFDYVAEHPVESVGIAVSGVFLVSAIAIAFPTIVASLGAFWGIKTMVTLISILIGVAIFNDKEE